MPWLGHSARPFPPCESEGVVGHRALGLRRGGRGGRRGRRPARAATGALELAHLDLVEAPRVLGGEVQVAERRVTMSN